MKDANPKQQKKFKNKEQCFQNPKADLCVNDLT